MTTRGFFVNIVGRFAHIASLADVHEHVQVSSLCVSSSDVNWRKIY